MDLLGVYCFALQELLSDPSMKTLQPKDSLLIATYVRNQLEPVVDHHVREKPVREKPVDRHVREKSAHAALVDQH